jgi:lipoprotein-releasing system ATP-binding protein
MREVNQQDGTTFLICTHDEGVAARCSRRLTLEDGQLASNVATPAGPMASAPGAEPKSPV